MSDIAQVPAVSSAMIVAVAVMKAAQQMAENTVAMLTDSAAGTEGRAALPYTRMLDKLA